MVRLALAVWMAAAAASPVAAQEVDWSGAGGDMFGAETSPAAGETEAGEVRLAELDPPFAGPWSRQPRGMAWTRSSFRLSWLWRAVSVRARSRPPARPGSPSSCL